MYPSGSQTHLVATVRGGLQCGCVLYVWAEVGAGSREAKGRVRGVSGRDEVGFGYRDAHDN